MITRALKTSVAAVVLLSAGHAIAQTTIEVAPEQRTVIRQYIVKERVPQVTVRERVNVGSVVPPDVELREVPADWGPTVTRYRYYYSGDRVYFVDPSSRRVIYDIDEGD